MHAHIGAAELVQDRRTTGSARGLTPGLTDVARRAGVSLATASRALNGSNASPVSATTRLRVQVAAKELDYQFNPSAKSLRTGRMDTVAVLVHDIADPYFAEIVKAVTSTAEAAGLLTMVCSSNRDPATELRYVRMLQQNRAAIVLFAGGGLEDAAYRRTIKQHVDAINDYGGAVVAMAPRAGGGPAEIPDNFGGAVTAAEHLLGLGHRRIAMVAGPPHLRTSRERRSGYLKALAGAGIDPPTAFGDFTPAGGGRATRELLESGARFTALLVSNDSMAIGALAALRQAGISVPEQVSVIGFDDIPGLDFINPALTTVGVPLAEIGVAAVTRALSMLAGARIDRRAVLHPVRLVERSSTAPPPRRRHG